MFSALHQFGRLGVLGGPRFSPRQLFSGGTPGPWFDGSDFSTMFQDLAGSTPVTALEQTVGLWLDKSRGGMGALGIEQSPALSAYIAMNANGSWSGSTATRTSASGFFGTVATTASGFGISGRSFRVRIQWSGNTAGTLFCDLGNVTFNMGAAASGNVAFVLSPTGGNNLFVYCTGGAVSSSFTIESISAREIPGSHAVAPNDGSRGVVTARVNRLEGTAVLATQTVTVVAATHTLRFSGTGSVTLSGVATGTFSAGVHSVVCTAGSLTVTVTGQVLEADLRPSDQATGLIPTYQRVTTATDYDSAGFPVGVKFDGSDDSYSTASINYSTTDKVTVFAGTRKNSDAAQGVVAELTATIASNNGAFLLAAPDGATDTFGWDSKGTSQVDAVATGVAAPRSSVLTGIGDIGNDVCTLRVNGAQADTDTGNQGSGNYSNAAMFIGRRNNTNQPLNGIIYQLIAPGKLCSDAEIAQTEAYIRQKTGAY